MVGNNREINTNTFKCFQSLHNKVGTQYKRQYTNLN